MVAVRVGLLSSKLLLAKLKCRHAVFGVGGGIVCRGDL